MLMEPRSLYRSRWFMPAFSTVLGLLILGAFVAADDLGTGVAGLGMVAVGLIFLIGGRRGDGHTLNRTFSVSPSWTT